MVQVSVESYQDEQRSLWRRLTQYTVLVVAGLFLAILVTAFTPGLNNTAHAARVQPIGIARYGAVVQPIGIAKHGAVVQPIGVVGQRGNLAQSTGIVGRGDLIQQTAAVRHAGGNVVQQILIAKTTNGTIIQRIINVFPVVYRRW